jgi:phenylpropionate dioxygenase-like ring-hydroxylating dioxygenase large terminal subunit
VEEAAAASAPADADYVATTADAAAAAGAADWGEQQIDWHKQWYPLAIIADLDARRPHAVRLLNEPLVLWRDAGGAWRAFADRCPHRLAPLSEGRVDPARLVVALGVCSYRCCPLLRAEKGERGAMS